MSDFKIKLKNHKWFFYFNNIFLEDYYLLYKYSLEKFNIVRLDQSISNDIKKKKDFNLLIGNGNSLEKVIWNKKMILNIIENLINWVFIKNKINNFICTKVPHCVEEFMVNSIKFKIIISKLIVFPKVFHTFA